MRAHFGSQDFRALQDFLSSGAQIHGGPFGNVSSCHHHTAAIGSDPDEDLLCQDVAGWMPFLGVLLDRAGVSAQRASNSATALTLLAAQLAENALAREERL